MLVLGTVCYMLEMLRRANSDQPTTGDPFGSNQGHVALEKHPRVGGRVAFVALHAGRGWYGPAVTAMVAVALVSRNYGWSLCSLLLHIHSVAKDPTPALRWVPWNPA